MSRCTVVSRGVRVDVDDHDHGVARGAEASRGLGEDQHVLVVAPVDGEVAQLLQRGVRPPDLVEPGEERRQGAPSRSAASQSRMRTWNFSESRYSSPRLDRDVLEQLGTPE